MATELIFDAKDLNELQDAIRKNPTETKNEVAKFLQRGVAAYKSIIFNNPWRMGASGGGAPISQAEHGGNLRATHATEIQTWQATIKPTAPYAPYVHGIEGYPRKRSYQLRPWLDFAVNTGKEKIEQLQDQMVDAIIDKLAK